STRAVSFAAAGESNMQSSTLVAYSENRAKLTPAPSQVAPSGYGRPGQTRMSDLREARSDRPALIVWAAYRDEGSIDRELQSTSTSKRRTKLARTIAEAYLPKTKPGC